MNKSEAYLNGWFAHKNDIEIIDDNNPYLENTQRYSYNQWISGWCDRSSSLKHMQDMSIDDLDVLS